MDGRTPANVKYDGSQLQAENTRLRDELRATRERLLQLEIDIRAQIGRELHDGPIQQVAAAGLHVNYLRRILERAPGMTPQAIEELDDQLAKAMHSLRTVLLELRPVGLKEHGLAWMTEQYALKFPPWEGLRFAFEIEPDLPRMPVEHETALFIIVQEAIMNVRKHAKASVVTITMRVVDHTFRVVVSDDGTGFDMEAQQERQIERGSVGLLSMRERAERMGGTVEVLSTPGSGTAVTITVPLAK
jgi:signal transduction histidine kinase